MSSLYRRRLKSGFVWYANIRLRDGTRKNFCTGAKSRAAAMEILRAAEVEIAVGRDPFRVKHFGSGLSLYIAAFLQAREPFWAVKTREAYKDTCQRIARLWGDSLPLAINPDNVAEFRRSLRSMAPASINHYLRHAAAFFRWCVAEGYLQSCCKIERVKQAGSKQRDYYTPDECRALLSAAAGVTIAGRSFRTFLALLMTTGLRLGEAIAIQQDWIDRKRRLIRIPPERTKAGRKRIVPVAADLLAELPDGERLFPWSLESGYLREVWGEVVERAGVRRLKLHNLRDTAAVGMILSGVPLPVVSRILGHASVTTTMQHYADLTGEEGDVTAFSTDLLRPPVSV